MFVSPYSQMLIRTPNGETLHVRQMDDAFYPENLAIFTDAGERVHSSHLMAQVIESLSDLPRDDGSESNPTSLVEYHHLD
ncbi:unnamed protein product [Dicrocoelium dendriticum]|nr:unnamed protein product [Dicrocoelium dendriticum]